MGHLGTQAKWTFWTHIGSDGFAGVVLVGGLELCFKNGVREWLRVRIFAPALLVL